MGLLNLFERQTSNTVSIGTYVCYNLDVSSDLFYLNKSIFQYLRQAKWNFFWWTRVILYSFIILSLYASNLMNVSGMLLPCLLSHVSHFIWSVMLLPGFLAFHPLFKPFCKASSLLTTPSHLPHLHQMEICCAFGDAPIWQWRHIFKCLELLN